MNIIYSNFDDLYWIKFINELKDRKKIHPICIIDNKNFINDKKLSKQNCDFFDNVDCIKSKIDNKHNFANTEIFKNRIFKVHEKISFDLLDRFSQNTNSYRQDEKYEIYKNTIIFWYDYLIKKKPDIYFSKLPPHQFYDYIIYLCCRLLRIKTLCFFPTYFHPRVFLNDNINIRSKVFLNKNVEKFNFQNSKNFIDKFKEKFKLDYSAAAPYYIKKYNFVKKNYFKFLIYYAGKLFLNVLRGSFLKKSNVLDKNYASNLENISLLRFNYLELKAVIKKFQLSKYYLKNSSFIKKGEKYLYFASAYQPEYTNSPYGGNFFDQIETLKIIRNAIPENIKIYYKEHPVIFNPNPLQSGHKNRSIEYYKQLLKIKNLKFIRQDQNSFDLIDNSLLVATISGETGIEAFFRKKPCIVFSNTWYSKLNGIFIIKSKKNLKNNYEKIINFNSFDNENNFLDDLYSKSIDMTEVNDLSKNLSIEKIDELIEYFNYSIRNLTD